MDLLVSCQDLSKSFGSRTLFTDLSLSIFEGDRIGLIGLNGCGKSTLLKILKGFEKSDSGLISPKRGLKIGYLPQSCEFADKTPFEVLMDVLSHLPEMEDYNRELLAQTWLSKLGFKGNEPLASRLSGGWKKRLGLACELILSPELILLDEPTNHLDLDGVLWLEKFLLRESPTYLVVSHDRYFLQHVTNKIIEIDKVYPRGLFAIEGSYSYFLSKKEEFIQGQINQEKSLGTKARRETEWLRAGVKARTTKSRSRIDEANAILEAHSDIKNRNLQKTAKISFASSERETRKLIVAKNLKKGIEGRDLFRNLDFTLSPGTRLGLMGPNGSGKTTLLRLISGEIMPDMGTVKRAEDLQIVYFDQHRAQLSLDLTLRDALSPKGDYVEFRGQKVHVNGWCKRFLFSPDILEMKIGMLSGGERARIAIAHLMLQKADILLLDEPTNDLDIPTLEALEESLQEFPGAVVLITHDRCMMDRICNTILSLGDPDHVDLFADYGQWEASLKEKTESKVPVKNKEKKELKSKRTYMEQKEFAGIEGKIEKLEQDLHLLTRRLEETETATNPENLSKVCAEIGLVETQIEQLYLRWEELSRKE
jgi:ABC transport system ATP-binding/permease protein